MYWSTNIKRDEVERYRGRCLQASKLADGDLQVYIQGAAAAMEALLLMDYGNDEEAFISKVSRLYVEEAGDAD